VIVQLRKASRAPLRMLHGLVLHNAYGSYTDEADAVLRGERWLVL
jgi:tRNA1(Val) A37 N6-methylase TrmN6